MSAGARPEGGARRLREPDVLRGFALSGILLVNAELMAGPYPLTGGGPGAPLADRVVAWLVTALVAGKFSFLFSFLFGYGFALQRRSARRAGVPFAPLHLRRALGLFGIGLAHAVLLYPGDILTTYAVLALVLYGLRGLSPRAALRLAAGLLAGLAALLLAYGLLTTALTAPATTLTDPATALTAPATTLTDPATTLTAPATAPTAPATAPTDPATAPTAPATAPADPATTPTDPATAPTAPATAPAEPAPPPAGAPPGLAAAFGTALLYAPHKLAGFLAGLAAAKSSLAERRGRDREWQRRVVARWLPVGLAGGAFSACCTAGPLDDRWFLAGRAVAVLTGPALAAAYACGLLLLLDAVGPAAGRVLAAAGRLSLTHYLTQSLVLAWVFTGLGLARYGRVGSATLLLGCLALYAAQLAVGARLAARVRYGPAEWLLRALTRARRPGRPAPGPGRPEDAPRPVP